MERLEVTEKDLLVRYDEVIDSLAKLNGSGADERERLAEEQGLIEKRLGQKVVGFYRLVRERYQRDGRRPVVRVETSGAPQTCPGCRLALPVAYVSRKFYQDGVGVCPSCQRIVIPTESDRPKR